MLIYKTEVCEAETATLKWDEIPLVSMALRCDHKSDQWRFNVLTPIKWPWYLEIKMVNSSSNKMYRFIQNFHIILVKHSWIYTFWIHFGSNDACSPISLWWTELAIKMRMWSIWRNGVKFGMEQTEYAAVQGCTNSNSKLFQSNNECWKIDTAIDCGFLSSK